VLAGRAQLAPLATAPAEQARLYTITANRCLPVERSLLRLRLPQPVTAPTIPIPRRAQLAALIATSRIKPSKLGSTPSRAFRRLPVERSLLRLRQSRIDSRASSVLHDHCEPVLAGRAQLAALATAPDEQARLYTITCGPVLAGRAELAALATAPDEQARLYTTTCGPVLAGRTQLAALIATSRIKPSKLGSTRSLRTGACR